MTLGQGLKAPSFQCLVALELRACLELETSLRLPDDLHSELCPSLPFLAFGFLHAFTCVR